MNDSWEDYDRFMPQVSLVLKDIWDPSKFWYSVNLHIWGSTNFQQFPSFFLCFCLTETRCFFLISLQNKSWICSNILWWNIVCLFQNCKRTNWACFQKFDTMKFWISCANYIQMQFLYPIWSSLFSIFILLITLSCLGQWP